MIHLWATMVIVVVSLVGLAVLGDWWIGMHGVSAYGAALDLGSAVLAFAMVLIGLRLMDHQLGYSTARRLHGMDDHSLAIYLAGRLIAVGLLLGLALS